MHRSLLRNAAVLVALATVVACAEDPTSAIPEPSFASMVTDTIPTRAQEYPGSWANRPDSAVWNRAASADSTVLIGMRAPGRTRGTWRGNNLIRRDQWTQAQNAIREHPGVTVLYADSLRPFLLARVSGVEVVSSLRKLPFVDYVEPNRLNAPTGSPSVAADQCFSEGGSVQTTPLGNGDLVHPSFSVMRIPEAWRFSNGEGVTIGSIDTGVTPVQGELNENFASGESGGRWVSNHIYYTPGCGHGTRVASVIASPKNGTQTVGVAWKSNLATTMVANDVVSVNATDALWGVRRVGDQGARVIGIAMQFDNSSALADEIKAWYYQRDVFFVGAAGTGLKIRQVIFPAEMSEVFAVTGVDYNGETSLEWHPTSCSSCFYSWKVEVAGFVPQASLFLSPGQVVALKGSSVATATVTGVAALVRSRYPNWDRGQVWARMRASGAMYPSKDPEGRTGYGLINAFAAVGGFHGMHIEDEGIVYANSTTLVEAIPYGDGPFTYRWSNGQTTRTATYNTGACGSVLRVEATVTDTRDGTVHHRFRDVNVGGIRCFR